MPERWSVAGSYFDACNCETVCPCVFLSTPTTGECTTLFAWHIDRGNFGDVTLDGLNVALAVYAPGHMMQVKWKAGLYLDERGTGDQRDALTQIFTGQVGGHLAILTSFIDEMLGVKSVAIDFHAEGKRRSVTIADIADVEIEAIEGQAGSDAMISNFPLTCVPGEPVVVARSRRLNYLDHGMKWEVAAKHGVYSPFYYQGS